ncbi:ribosomal protein S18-alanine N-acetyltransferase [Salinimonas profundi]|uniref:ribosomal protein S18-alanine N-acetyltransferase n=1 Tax=Salinimonas profundi TaxID=2729140 RepID=UPI00295F03E7|nr:ribosomal protein S18-alanine N-acetyltransferase [Salinimonas profundi]
MALKIVRKVSPDDHKSIDRAYHIHEQVTYSPWSYATFADCITPPYQMMVICETDVIGYAMILMVADEATLMDIGVSPAARGKGAGKALIQKVIEICTQQKMATIWLEVRVSNSVAINLYKSQGFSDQEVRKNYYETNDGKEDAIIMKRVIN